MHGCPALLGREERECVDKERFRRVRGKGGLSGRRSAGLHSPGLYNQGRIGSGSTRQHPR